MPSVARQSASHALSAKERSPMANEPTNKALYSRVKTAAKKKFAGKWPSAYGSAWLTREYKKRGGTYRTVKKSGKK